MKEWYSTKPSAILQDLFHTHTNFFKFEHDYSRVSEIYVFKNTVVETSLLGKDGQSTREVHFVSTYV